MTFVIFKRPTPLPLWKKCYKPTYLHHRKPRSICTILFHLRGLKTVAWDDDVLHASKLPLNPQSPFENFLDSRLLKIRPHDKSLLDAKYMVYNCRNCILSTLKYTKWWLRLSISITFKNKDHNICSPDFIIFSQFPNSLLLDRSRIFFDNFCTTSFV